MRLLRANEKTGGLIAIHRRHRTCIYYRCPQFYRDGEHGFAISKTNGLPVADWTNQCTVWFKRMGLIAK